MLDAHPAIAWPFEFNFALGALDPDGESQDLEVLKQRLEAEWGFRHWELHFDTSLGLKNAYCALLEELFHRAGDGKSIYGVTVHARLHLLTRFWPEARFIHLVRDPRDVAPSVIQMGWAGTAWHAAGHWEKAELEVDELITRVPPDRILSIRYEDLVSEPIQTLSTLCSFLDLDFDPRMLRYPEWSTYSHPKADSVFRWRTHLPARSVQEIEFRVGTLMQKRGYPLSGLPELRMNVLRRTHLWLLDRVRRVRNEIARYGVRLVIGRILASRLGLSERSVQIHRRMQDLDELRVRADEE